MSLMLGKPLSNISDSEVAAHNLHKMLLLGWMGCYNWDLWCSSSYWQVGHHLGWCSGCLGCLFTPPYCPEFAWWLNQRLPCHKDIRKRQGLLHSLLIDQQKHLQNTSSGNNGSQKHFRPTTVVVRMNLLQNRHLRRETVPSRSTTDILQLALPLFLRHGVLVFIFWSMMSPAPRQILCRTTHAVVTWVSKKRPWLSHTACICTDANSFLLVSHWPSVALDGLILPWQALMAPAALA